MKNLQKITFLVIIVISFLSCEKKLSNIELQKKVLNDIFIEIVDSTYIDRRIYCLFPKQGKPIYNKDGKWIGIDTTGQHKRDLEFNLNREKIENDTSKIVIAVGKDNYGFKGYEEKLFVNHFKNISVKKDEFEKVKTYIIDLNNYKKNKKFAFKNYSEFPQDYKIWYEKYDFELSCVITYSNIIFDKTKKYGFLNISVFCGEKCGQGYLVFVENKNGKWKINKIDQTWIS